MTGPYADQDETDDAQAARTLSTARRVQMRTQHRRSLTAPVCGVDGQRWPCEKVTLLDALEDAEAKIAELTARLA